jgi:hypothetical protein
MKDLRKAARGRGCQVSGCDRQVKTRGLCQMHYFRLRRTGSPTTEPYSCTRGGEDAKFLENCIPVPESGCWLWLGSIATTGYGKSHYRGREISAHRLSYLLFVGEIPAGLHILHSCDERSCVNPQHLRAGTNADNVEDALKRFRVGKLAKHQIQSIKQDPRSTRAIGAEYGISSTQVSAIKRGLVWQNVI